MNICVIGGSGFLGTHFFEIAKDNSDKLTNLDKQQSYSNPELTSLVDVRDQDGLNKTLHNQDTVILLAAEHRDDVSPVSAYYDVNVQGTINVLHAMDLHNIKNIIFTSSVAVYGLNKQNPDENHPVDPFNHYGKTKLQAEEVLREWYQKDAQNRSLTIIRPTVIFGEDNRGNVYNLLKQIASGNFIRIGKGENVKSMAYVRNVAAFVKHQVRNIKPGYQIFNYVDKPDFTVNDIIEIVEKSLNKRVPGFHIPKWIGIAGGMCFDLLAVITKKKYAVSSIRVKKYCATTEFNSVNIQASAFKAPFTLSDGFQKTLIHEFVQKHGEDRVLFENE